MTPSEVVALAGVRGVTDNNQSGNPRILDSLQEVKGIVTRIFDSASIHTFKMAVQGTQFLITVPKKYTVPQLCLKALESNGYPVQTLASGEHGLEISIGGIRK